MTDQKNQGAAIPTPQGAAGRLFRMIVQGNALRLLSPFQWTTREPCSSAVFSFDDVVLRRRC